MAPRRPSALHAVLALWCGCLLVLAAVGPRGAGPVGDTVPVVARTGAHAEHGPGGPRDRTDEAVTPRSTLPGGRTRVFAGGRVLVAYYGVAGSGALGVLGEDSPGRIWPRLVRAARPFAKAGPVQPVFELIVSVATRGPGPDGDYSADVPRSSVRRYLEAAHRHGALVLLDLQTGRSDFLTVARRWAWALRDPWVGLALDPEWRMGPHQRPGRTIGEVGARELNRVSAWLDRFTAAHRLPEKVFMVHQFRTDMVRGIDRVRHRPHLTLVQHVDGFGTPRQKLATYHAVVRPRTFHEGFKLFYDEDVHRMSPARVLRIRPRVSFVSFQ